MTPASFRPLALLALLYAVSSASSIAVTTTTSVVSTIPMASADPDDSGTTTCWTPDWSTPTVTPAPTETESLPPNPNDSGTDACWTTTRTEATSIATYTVCA